MCKARRGIICIWAANLLYLQSQTIALSKMILYDPRADIIFRKIFGQHKNLCISLLNALLPLADDEKVVSIEYEDPDMLPDRPELKNSVVDVRCTDMKGRRFIVEMQMYWTQAFFARTLLNVSKAYAGQAQKGNMYSDLQPVYALCLLNDDIPDTRQYLDEYSHVYTIRHDRHNELTIGGMKFVFVELKKFQSTNRAHNKLAELWLSFLTMVEGKKADVEVPQALLDNPDTNAAVQCLKEMSLTGTERATYEKYWDAVSYQKTLIRGKYDEGRAKGKAEGLAEGLAEGKAEATLTIARRMLAMGMCVEQVAAATGLPAADVDELK